MIEELLILLPRCSFAVTVMMLSAWGLSLVKRDTSIVDIAWGLGFITVAWTAYLFGQNTNPTRSLLLPVLTTIWGTRLAGYLFWRNHGKPEDYRYRAMREKWGNAFPFISLLTVFGMQGVVMWIVSLPIQVGTALHNRSIVWLTAIGVTIWTIGLLFEAVGDWQLARFKFDPNNKGRVLDKGLWRYTRHPNYFGDFLVWWGLYFVALSVTRAWWTIVGPITMSIFLMKISGVTLLEKSLEKTKPGYASYAQRTNAFFPGPPQS